MKKLSTYGLVISMFSLVLQMLVMLVMLELVGIEIPQWAIIWLITTVIILVISSILVFIAYFKEIFNYIIKL